MSHRIEKKKLCFLLVAETKQSAHRAMLVKCQCHLNNVDIEQ